MADIRAQVILKTVDAVPENYVSNSWAFNGIAPGTDDAAVVTLLKDFYDDITASYWPTTLAQNGHTVKLSLLPGATPNYPYYEGTFNFANAPAGVPLPSECAVALSFQGFRSAGLPQARRRGRVYIGPLSVSVNSSGRPIASYLTALSNAAATLLASAAIISDEDGWCVWSVADQSMVAVDNGWIDNSFDTQRRRGVGYTSRTTFT